MDRADDPLAEIRWLETLDKSSGVAIRYIGFTDLAAPDAGAALVSTGFGWPSAI